MKKTTDDFRNGLILEFNNDYYIIVEFQHVKPGKGGAFVRTKLKSVTTGRILENTFNAGVEIKTARIEKRKYSLLYKNANIFTFMKTDDDDYEQIEIDEKMIEKPLLIKDGQEVYILYHAENDKILGVELPITVEMTITSVEPYTKGNTVTASTKKATTETGLEISVPPFIEENDIIKIDTRTCKYIERVSKK
jgi:elongation factor P